MSIKSLCLPEVNVTIDSDVYETGNSSIFMLIGRNGSGKSLFLRCFEILKYSKDGDINESDQTFSFENDSLNVKLSYLGNDFKKFTDLMLSYKNIHSFDRDVILPFDDNNVTLPFGGLKELIGDSLVHLSNTNFGCIDHNRYYSSLMPDSIKKFLLYKYITIDDSNKFIGIDNFCNNLDPSIVKHLMHDIIEYCKNKLMFIATNSSYVMDYFMYNKSTVFKYDNVLVFDNTSDNLVIKLTDIYDNRDLNAISLGELYKIDQCFKHNL
jgi:ABC-type enterochelin transport system ATPase subunit